MRATIACMEQLEYAVLTLFHCGLLSDGLQLETFQKVQS